MSISSNLQYSIFNLQSGSPSRDSFPFLLFPSAMVVLDFLSFQTLPGIHFRSYSDIQRRFAEEYRFQTLPGIHFYSYLISFGMIMCSMPCFDPFQGFKAIPTSTGLVQTRSRTLVSIPSKRVRQVIYRFRFFGTRSESGSASVPIFGTSHLTCSDFRNPIGIRFRIGSDFRNQSHHGFRFLLPEYSSSTILIP